MAKLKSHVHVTDATGRVHSYGPGDEVPSEHADLITNPAAWEDEPKRSESSSAQSAPTRAPKPQRSP